MKRLEIQTPRLLLRPWTLADAATIAALDSDPEVYRYTGDLQRIKSVADAEKMLREVVFPDYEKHGFGRGALVLKETGEVIGMAGLKYMDDVQEVDVGYRLMRKFWGNGYATEASQAALKFGFGELGLERIVAIIHPDNTPSVRVAEKCGMRYEGLRQFDGMTVEWYSAGIFRPVLE